MIKIALLETIEALVSAIKNNFLTKTEAKSIYQPKASAINTNNIGSQSVNYAYEAYMADKADELRGHATFSTSFPSQGQGLLRYYISASNYDGQPPADGAILYMGATGGNGTDHQVAFCDDGELYIKHMIDGTWQPWNRMAKASEIPDVSGFATEDWVTSNYFNLQEMDDNYYRIGDVDSMLDNYLPKSGGTVTGTLNVKALVVNPRIYESRESDSNLVFQAYMVNNNTKKAHNYSYGADVITFGKGWSEMTPEHLYYKGYIHTTEFLRIKDVKFQFNPSNNTLNISGVSGQTVHIAVNGKVIA